MDAIFDSILSGLEWLVAGLGALFLAACWRRIKGGLKIAGNWLWREIQWIIVAKVVVKVLRTIFEGLKSIDSPRHRAYFLLQADTMILQEIAKFVGRPGISREVAATIGEIMDIVHPIIRGYVDSVRRDVTKPSDVSAGCVAL